MVLLAITGLAEFYGMAAKRELVASAVGEFLAVALLMVGTFFSSKPAISDQGSPSRVKTILKRLSDPLRPWLVLRQFFSRSNTAA